MGRKLRSIMANNMNEMMNEMMNNMMNTMMQGMMQAMCNNMANVMQSMFNPTPATVEAEQPKTTNQPLTREQFMAMHEQEVAENSAKTPTAPLDFIVLSTGRITFNQSVSHDIWTANYLKLKRDYPNIRYDRNTHGFCWNKSNYDEFFAFCNGYSVITTLSEDDKKAIKNYEVEKARKRAEYANKKLAEINK